MYFGCLFVKMPKSREIVKNTSLAVNPRGGEVPNSSEKIRFLSFYFNFPFLVVFFSLSLKERLSGSKTIYQTLEYK